MQIFFASGSTKKAHSIDPRGRQPLPLPQLQRTFPEILNANYLILHQAVNFRIASAKEVTVSALQKRKL